MYLTSQLTLIASPKMLHMQHNIKLLFFQMVKYSEMRKLHTSLPPFYTAMTDLLFLLELNTEDATYIDLWSIWKGSSSIHNFNDVFTILSM